MLIFSLSLLTVERYNKSIWCKRSRYVSWWWSVSGPGKHNKKSSTKNRTHMYDGAFNLFCLWIKKLEFFDRKIAPEGEKCIAIWINLGFFYYTARMLNFSWKMKEKILQQQHFFQPLPFITFLAKSMKSMLYFEQQPTNRREMKCQKKNVALFILLERSKNCKNFHFCANKITYGW